ncbi:aconitase family protein, partial [Escherichia coli]|nr:aconitase family protein [Escherichia coli]
WKALASDEGAEYDQTLEIDANEIEPVVTWGTNPAMSSYISKTVPTFESCNTDSERKSLERALDYMGLTPGMAIEDIPIQHVFIGSCTNARLSDLRDAASFIKGKKVSPNVRATVV